MNKQSADSLKTIMIIDDEPNNLNVLESMLCEEGGYEVVAFPDGAMALSLAAKEPPDLILLDICMPRMDGFEVCRRLKTHPDLAGIPVLFLSALSDPLDKVKAFDAGGMDYITKPLSESEVLARVRTHLSLRAYQLDMEEQVRRRTNELAEAHRRLQILDDAKTQWLSVLSHEMRTPLTGLFGVADYVFAELPEESTLNSFREDYAHVRERMLKLVDDACLLTSIRVDSDHFRQVPVSLQTIVHEALQAVKDSHASIKVGDTVNILGDTRILANSALLFRAVGDLLRVATLCVGQGDRIQVMAEEEAGMLKLLFSTKGPQLDAESLNSFFEVGGQRKVFVPGGDFGLRPALAQRIIALCRGSVSVRNNRKRGIAIEILLPSMDARTATAGWLIGDGMS